MERKEPYCFGIVGNNSHVYEMQYVAISKGKVSIKYDLYDPNNKLIYTNSGNRTAYFKQQLFLDGIYTICFTNQLGDDPKLSFDIMSLSGEATAEILEKEHLSMIEYELKTMYQDLEKVNKLINEHTERVANQKDLIANSKSSSKWWCVCKCIVIFFV